MLQSRLVGPVYSQYVARGLPNTPGPNADGSYSASIKAPQQGWIGFMIEVEYRRDDDPNHYMEVTSEVNIVPDIYPFEPCSKGNGC